MKKKKKRRSIVNPSLSYLQIWGVPIIVPEFKRMDKGPKILYQSLFFMPLQSNYFYTLKFVTIFEKNRIGEYFWLNFSLNTGQMVFTIGATLPKYDYFLRIFPKFERSLFN